MVLTEDAFGFGLENDFSRAQKSTSFPRTGTGIRYTGTGILAPESGFPAPEPQYCVVTFTI